MHYIYQIPEIATVFKDADHIDIKTVESDKNLREFMADLIGYQPGWVTFLYRVRAVFVRFLGMRQAGIPKPPRLTPQNIPMAAGAKLAFFTVKFAQEDAYLIAEIIDAHLTAVLGIVAEPLRATQRRFHVVTVVHYNNWAGPVYFNIIRPFHHIVLGGMARAGAGR